MSWLTKILGVDKAVQKQVKDILNDGPMLPNSVASPRLLQYRSEENKVWASSNPNNLLAFYKHKQEPVLYADRFQFWSWVDGINVPKVHYPAPEIILNFIKGILFSGDLTITGDNEVASETEINDFNSRILNALEDIGFDDFAHNGSLYETYSGSLAAKFVIDPEVHGKPIIQLYPKEKFELETKYGKVIEYIFIDTYYRKDKTYTLHSHYGKGYIRYKLYEDDKLVGIDKIPDTAGLKDFEYGGDIILAAWKKNRTVSNEFSELIYGGSDFEGIIDIFHAIDEIFSSLMLYIRRSRPIMGIDESLMPMNADGSKTIIPKEYSFDMLSFRNNESNKDKIYRDNPEIKTDAYMTSIQDLMLSAYQKIGISYSSANDSGIGANASGEAISKREKTTTVMRDSKIKLWMPFIVETLRIYFICEDLMENTIINKDYKDWKIRVEFPEYNGQTFAEKVKETKDAIDAGVMDIATGVDRVYDRDYSEEEKALIVRNAKIEKGAPLFQKDLEVEE